VFALERRTQGFYVKIIAQENSNVRTPSDMDGFLSSSEFRVIDNIIMDKAGSMDSFNQGGHEDMLFSFIAQHFRAEYKEGGPNPFAAFLKKIIADLCNELIVRAGKEFKSVLNFVQVFSDIGIQSDYVWSFFYS
jgi:hypothetical protein